MDIQLPTHFLVAFLSGVGAGWWARGSVEPEPGACNCVCNCRCGCELGISTGTWIALAALVAALLVGLWIVLEKIPSKTTSSPTNKGNKGVFGTTGKLSIAG